MNGQDLATGNCARVPYIDRQSGPTFAGTGERLRPWSDSPKVVPTGETWLTLTA